MSPRELSCARVRRLLPWVPGNEVPQALDASVRAHLASCADCRSELGGLLRARRALRSLAADVVNGVDSPAFTKLREDTLAAVRRAPVPRAVSLQAMVGTVGMAAALFLIGAIFLARLVPAPESWRDLPAIEVSVPDWHGDGGRIRYVGYGLLGRQRIVQELEQRPAMGLEVEAGWPESSESTTEVERRDPGTATPREGVLRTGDSGRRAPARTPGRSGVLRR
ncbi:MAG: zf-HC2 domain-containing protein [Planctomycetes bacterium]|nr:zf-HC2 domain-containing protein [Planctomycetota bacterium]